MYTFAKQTQLNDEDDAWTLLPRLMIGKATKILLMLKRTFNVWCFDAAIRRGWKKNNTQQFSRWRLQQNENGMNTLHGCTLHCKLTHAETTGNSTKYQALQQTNVHWYLSQYINANIRTTTYKHGGCRALNTRACIREDIDCENQVKKKRPKFFHSLFSVAILYIQKRIKPIWICV